MFIFVFVNFSENFLKVLKKFFTWFLKWLFSVHVVCRSDSFIKGDGSVDNSSGNNGNNGKTSEGNDEKLLKILFYAISGYVVM